MPRSFIAFLLIACFGVLFVGCSPLEPEKSFEEFTFTEEDLAKVENMLAGEERGSGSVPTLTALSGATASGGPVVLDVAAQRRFDDIRAGVSDDRNLYRVANEFLNVRQSMSVSSPQVARLVEGDAVIVLDIPNASWAKVQLLSGQEGYVAFRYIVKVTTEERLAEEKAKFAGKYFVDFTFLNVRTDPSAQGEKIGELPGYAIIQPLHVDKDWARVPFEGKEGYVSTQYLQPFEPSFLVRQENYVLPILRYRASEPGSMDALAKHMAGLKSAGKNIVTLRYLYDVVMQQENRDTRIAPGTVVLTVSDITAENIKDVSQALGDAGVVATLFIPTKEIGLSGITEKTVLTLLANGNDLQSGAHTGDDLRSLTDSQVELELGQSKKILEEMTHKDAYAISYPLGGVVERVMGKAAAAGYLFGVGQVPKDEFTRSDFLQLPSIAIGPGLSETDVLGLLE